MSSEEAESFCSTGIVSNSSEGSSVMEASRLSCKEGFSDEASELSVISFSTSSCGSRTGTCEVPSDSIDNTSDVASDAASRGEFELEAPSTAGTRVSSSGDSSTAAVRQETRQRTANKRKKTFFTRVSPPSKQKGCNKKDLNSFRYIPLSLNYKSKKPIRQSKRP